MTCYIKYFSNIEIAKLKEKANEEYEELKNELKQKGRNIGITKVDIFNGLVKKYGKLREATII